MEKKKRPKKKNLVLDVNKTKKNVTTIFKRLPVYCKNNHLEMLA